MKIICEECGSTYKIKDELIAGKTSIKTQCPKCKFIQKNELIKEKETNPFEDNSSTVDFVASIKKKNKEINSKEFDTSTPERYKPVKELPDIDLASLQKEEIKEKISRKKKESITIGIEDSNISNISNISNVEQNKGLYSAKKGSSFLGPFTLEEIKTEIKKRRITKEFLFSKDGDDWKTIESHTELLPFFKEQNKSSNALKYLIIGIILILIAFVIVTLLDKYTNNDYIIVDKGSNITKKDNGSLLDSYIQKWKKNIIVTKSNDSVIYAKAIQNFYSNTSNLYIKSVNQFKEVLIKNPLKYDAFYYMILSLSFSDIKIEKENVLKEYLNILKSIKDPKKHNELYYNALSALSLKLEYFVDSFNYAKETKNIVSNNAISNYLLARFYSNSKKIDKTIKYLKISIKSDERLVIAKEFLGEIFILSEKFKEGISYYEKMDTKFSKYVLAKLYLKIGYYDKAFLILKKLSKDKKNKFDKFNILYARLLYQYKNNNKLALKILNRLEKNILFKLSKSDKIELLNNIAIIYRLKNNLAKSIKYSQKTLDIDKSNRVARFNLILIRIKQKKYQEANILISQFDKSTKNIDKYNYIIKLELYVAQNKYKEAIKQIRQIINLERYNNMYYLYMANIYAKMNNLNMIQEVLLKLNTINPDYYIENSHKLTKIYIKNINIKFLINYLNISLKNKDVDKALILNNLGLVYYQLKKFNKAIFYFSKSINLSERNISNYIYLSYINYKLKKYNDVIRMMESISRFGKSEYLYLIQVKSLLKLKKIKEARKLIKQARYDFKYSKVIKLAQALLYLELGKENLAVKILSELKDDFKYDLSYKKLLFSTNY